MPVQAFNQLRPITIVETVEVPGAAVLSTVDHLSVAAGADVTVSCLGVTQVKYGTISPITYVEDGSTNTSTTDSVPTMTSSTSPSGEVILSGNAPAVGDFGIFDDFNDSTTTTQWAVISPTGWGGYDYGAGVAKCINKFSISARYNYETHNPKNFTFEGSQDGVTWVVLGTWTNESTWTSLETRWYTVTNGTAYRMYRINISASYDASYCGCGEMQFVEAAPLTYGATWVQKQANTDYSIDIPDTVGTKTITVTNDSGSTQNIQIEYAS
jgi:hypothetical protein